MSATFAQTYNFVSPSALVHADRLADTMKPILCLLVALAAAADSLPVEGRTLQEAAKPTKPPSAISRFFSTVSPEQKTKLSTIMKEQRKLKDMADSAAKVCAPAHTELARLDSLRVSPHTPTCELAGTRQPASLCRHASPPVRQNATKKQLNEQIKALLGTRCTQHTGLARPILSLTGRPRHSPLKVPRLQARPRAGQVLGAKGRAASGADAGVVAEEEEVAEGDRGCAAARAGARAAGPAAANWGGAANRGGAAKEEEEELYEELSPVEAAALCEPGWLLATAPHLLASSRAVQKVLWDMCSCCLHGREARRKA